MRTITLILAACALVACSACDDTGRTTKPERFTVTWDADGTYTLRVRLDGSGTWVDEKTLDATATHARTWNIVEAFDLDVCKYDEHWFPVSMVPGVVVVGKLYPATVTGANWDSDGFAVLPQNAEGSFVTGFDPDFPPILSPTYFDAHPIAGHVSDPGQAIHYRTECRADGLLVTWDGTDHFFPRPTS